MVVLSQFYRREVRVQVSLPDVPASMFWIENSDDDGLRIAFAISRSNAPPPDTATIRIFGLGPVTRGRISALYEVGNTLRVKLFAGYAQRSELIFFGDVYKLAHNHERGESWTTTLTTGDGQDAYRSQMEASFAANVPIDTVRRLTEAALGLQPNASARAEFAAALATSRITTFENGFVATGPAQEVLTEIATTVGLKWWIRDGQIVYVRKDRATTDFAILLTPETGLLHATPPKELGDVEFRALLNPRIFPGRQVLLQDPPGVPIGAPAHRVDTATYQGDTHGDDWSVTCVARRASLLP